jgi:hypothetical protein
MAPSYITDNSNDTMYNIMKAVFDKHNELFEPKLTGFGDFVVITLTRID